MLFRSDKWLKINTEYAPKWPNITIKRDAPDGAKSFDGVEEAFEAVQFDKTK